MASPALLLTVSRPGAPMRGICHVLPSGYVALLLSRAYRTAPDSFLAHHGWLAPVAGAVFAGVLA